MGRDLKRRAQPAQGWELHDLHGGEWFSFEQHLFYRRELRRNDVVWNAHGLNELSEGHFRAYTSKDGLPPGNVNCLLPDSNGVLWIGTDNGLAFLRSGTVHALSDECTRLRA